MKENLKILVTAAIITTNKIIKMVEAMPDYSTKEDILTKLLIGSINMINKREEL